MQIAPDTHLTPSADATLKPIDDRGAIVDMRTGRCWELNRVAMAIWQLIADGKSVGEATDAVAVRFTVESGALKRDVLAFVQSLVNEGLLRP